MSMNSLNCNSDLRQIPLNIGDTKPSQSVTPHYANYREPPSSGVIK